jgi:replicative DNA helicase
MSDELIYPHDLELERAILGSIMIKPERLGEVRDRISPDDFYRHVHAELYSEYIAGKLTPFTAKTEMSAAEMSGLMDGIPRSFDLQHATDYLMDLSDRRRIMQTLQAAVAGIDDPDSSEELAATVVQNIKSSVRQARRGGKTLSDAIAEMMSELDYPVGVLPTGFATLDRMGAGYRPGELTVLAGRPSHGKTAWALQSALAVAKAGNAVWFASMEMTSSSLSMRLLSSESSVSFSSLRRSDLDEAEYKRLSESVGSMEGLPMKIDDKSGLSLGDLRRAMAGQAGALLVVDYLQLLQPPTYARAYRSREAEVGAMSQGLKAIAHDNKCAVLALCQLNRGVEHRRDGVPKLADLRDSGRIEQDADICFIIHRDDEAIVPTTTLAIRKFRNGPLGQLDLVFDGETQKFHERGPGDPVPQPESISAKVKSW